MESAGSPALHDDVAGLDLEALAAVDQRVGVGLAVEYPGEPVAQAGFFLLPPLMLRDDLVLAPFQRMIELAA